MKVIKKFWFFWIVIVVLLIAIFERKTYYDSLFPEGEKTLDSFIEANADRVDKIEVVDVGGKSRAIVTLKMESAFLDVRSGPTLIIFDEHGKLAKLDLDSGD